jgi:hypothetical protein
MANRPTLALTHHLQSVSTTHPGIPSFLRFRHGREQDRVRTRTTLQNFASLNPYANSFLYGRYGRESDDFKPLAEHINSNLPDSIKHGNKVLFPHSGFNAGNECALIEGGCEYFVIGSCLNKSSSRELFLQQCQR